MIEYRDTREFTSEQLERLFLSVGWISGKYPERLRRAMQGCGTVYSAWDGERLVGLVNAIDDGEMTAYIHYLLVDPEYQMRGIARRLLELMKEHYREYLYLIICAECKELIAFYEKQGFMAETEVTPLQIFNYGE